MADEFDLPPKSDLNPAGRQAGMEQHDTTLGLYPPELPRPRRSCSLPTVLEDHWPPVALLMPRRFNSAAIWRADGKCASSVKIGFMRSASSSACLLLASLPAVQPPSVWPRALAALRPSLVREETSGALFLRQRGK